MFDSIESAIQDISQGKMVIVLDDEDRENEGDFVMAAEFITPEAVNFMATHGRGIICTPIPVERAEQLELGLMVQANNSNHETAFTVSVDANNGGTGISANDRAQTVKLLAKSSTHPSELVKPGHIFPLISKPGGVLQRAGHTEASVDLVKLADSGDTGVICEIMNEDGTMARRDQLLEMAKKWDMKIITIKDLISYRRKLGHIETPLKEARVQETSVIDFPNKYGEFKLHMFETTVPLTSHHVALVKGEINEDSPVLVRVHSECLTGDIFGSLRCRCGSQREAAMKKIQDEGSGVLLYLRQEGRGIGLPNKIKAYALQDSGLDTVEANHRLGFPDDLREYGVGAQILRSLGVKKMRLMTNNPRKIVGLEGFGLEVSERVPLEIKAHESNRSYLQAKKEKLGHWLDLH